MTRGRPTDVTAEALRMLSILVFRPNSRMHRPDAHQRTRGFALKDFQFP